MNQVGFDGTWPRALSKQLNLNQRRKWSGQTVPAVEMFSKNHREEKKNSIAGRAQYRQYVTESKHLVSKGSLSL